MFSITRQAAPEDALLRTYRGAVHPERWGSYSDCFSVTIDRTVTLADFIVAFYTSPPFQVERLILRLLAGARSNDAGARALADGSASTFAVWYVGRRTATELLMCDRYERTRSWFRVAALDGGKTLLQFGSALAAVRQRRAQAPRPGGVFRVLMGFHVMYSQLLLSAAKTGLTKNRSAAAR